jgi:hypothetical protein
VGMESALMSFAIRAARRASSLACICHDEL